jgi:hypothetical protein
MNLLKNDLLMRKTGDRRRTELTEESASQCGLSAEFITPSRKPRDLGTKEFVSSVLLLTFRTSGLWSSFCCLAGAFGPRVSLLIPGLLKKFALHLTIL